MAIFNSYVKLPEGTHLSSKIDLEMTFQGRFFKVNVGKHPICSMVLVYLLHSAGKSHKIPQILLEKI